MRWTTTRATWLTQRSSSSNSERSMCAFALPTVGALRCDSLPAAAAGRAMCRRVRAWQEDTAAALDQLEREGLVECRARAAKLGCAPHAGSPRPAPFRCGAPAMVAAAESAVRRCSRQTHGASPSPSIAARNRWSRWHGASIDELDRVLALTHEQFLEEQLEVLCTYPPVPCSTLSVVPWLWTRRAARVPAYPPVPLQHIRARLARSAAARAQRNATLRCGALCFRWQRCSRTISARCVSARSSRGCTSRRSAPTCIKCTASAACRCSARRVSGQR